MRTNRSGNKHPGESSGNPPNHRRHQPALKTLGIPVWGTALARSDALLLVKKRHFDNN